MDIAKEWKDQLKARLKKYEIERPSFIKDMSTYIFYKYNGVFSKIFNCLYSLRQQYHGKIYVFVKIARKAFMYIQNCSVVGLDNTRQLFDYDFPYPNIIDSGHYLLETKFPRFHWYNYSIEISYSDSVFIPGSHEVLYKSEVSFYFKKENKTFKHSHYAVCNAKRYKSISEMLKDTS